MSGANPAGLFGVAAAWAYAAAAAVHRRWWLRPALRDRAHLLPLVVVGGLRAGGSGKTAVARELARRLADSGKNVAMIAYWLSPAPKGRGLTARGRGLAEVGPDADWRVCSDEAVLLARAGAGRVFVTRNRERAWEALSRMGGFDLLVSDDGLCDPRLAGALHLVLRAPNEAPRRRDLLPFGPYRTTLESLRDEHHIVAGPLAHPPPAGAGLWFRRRLEFPAGFDFGRVWWAVCGLGHPEAFCRDLEAAGVALAGLCRGPDHGFPSSRKRARAARRRPEAGFLCTAKDAVKLPASQRAGFAVIGERIELAAGLLQTVEEYWHGFSSW